MLDCLVLGYHEMDFWLYEQMALSKGAKSAEHKIFSRDQLLIDGRRMPYMDVLNYYLGRTATPPEETCLPWYHITEVPNMAAVYLTSYLNRRGISARFISSTRCERDKVETIMKDERPTVVALTTTFYVTPLPVIEACSMIRRLHPSARIIVGGPLINNLASDLSLDELESTLDAMNADIFVRESQGEATLAELITKLIRGERISSTPNCYIGLNGKMQFTGVKPENNSLDEEAVNWEQFSCEEIGPTAQMRTARSCAFKCGFCDYPIRAGALVLADLNVVRRELAQLAERNVQHVVFIDDTFNVPEKRFQDICRIMISEGYTFSWYSYFRCSNVRNEETFELMAQSRCGGVFLGIESADDSVLLHMNKHAAVDQYRRGISVLNSLDIPTFASFIVGFPGETAASVDRTIDFLNETCPTFYRAEPFWYNRRSPVASQAGFFGLQGQGYQWSHKTMDVETASSMIDRIFDRVSGSIWMPMYMFDFWALPYLRGKGMSIAQLRLFLSIAQRALEGQCGTGLDRLNALAELKQFCESLDLAPPKYSRTITHA